MDELAAANREYLLQECGGFSGLRYVNFTSTSRGRNRKRPAREVEMVGSDGRYYSITEDTGHGIEFLDRSEYGGTLEPDAILAAVREEFRFRKGLR